MAGERTPLFSTNGTPRRDQKRVFYAKVAAGLALAGVLGGVLYASTRDGTTSTVPVLPASAVGSGAAITEANWFCGETNFEAAYMPLTNKKGDDEYFYWFVPSRSGTDNTDPLVLWLTGGPGGSSLMAMLTENGPCLVKPDVSTNWNRYSWSNKANMIWLDQPSGVGYSAFDNPEDTDYTEADVGANIYNFLNSFLDKHPEFVGRDFYITGESYGGHYIPGASHYIWQQNKKNAAAGSSTTPPRINLKGIAIGNGLTNPNIQYSYNQDMVNNQYNISLLTEEQAAQMKADSVECIALTELCQQSPKNGTICADAQGCWGTKLIGPFLGAHRNNYDIRRDCTPGGDPVVCGQGYEYLDAYFANPIVHSHLAFTKHKWLESSDVVNQQYVKSGDWSFAYHTYVADMLDDGVRVLIYAGDADLMCNWIGNRAWTLALEWSGKSGFNAANETAFYTVDPYAPDDPVVDAGVVRQHANFAFLRLYNAGHMVPMDQPAVSWVMLDKFLHNEAL